MNAPGHRLQERFEMTPIVTYGVGSCLMGLVAFGSFQLTRPGADAAVVSAGQGLDASTLVAGCVRQELAKHLQPAHQTVGYQAAVLVTAAEARLTASTDDDLAAYFDDVAALQRVHGLAPRAMADVMAQVTTTLSTCRAVATGAVFTTSD
jgi:hypothetical protein